MRPVIVRLPNWVGDVVMALPALSHLAQTGFTPMLVGKAWAGPLLAGYGWEIHPRAQSLRARVAQLHELHRRAAGRDAHFGERLNTLLLTNSFSSALEAWLARLRTVGYRQDGRGWLLSGAVARPRDPLHESTRFWRLATVLSGSGMPQPASLRLRVAPLAQQAADALLAQHALGGDFACIVPFATGTLRGQSKAWPEFPRFARWLRQKLPVIVVPGPAEVEIARQSFPGILSLGGVDLGVYAGLLKRARLVVSNDTGPGHLASSVGAPLISVLGPTDAARYRPWGANVSVIQQTPWPTLEQVSAEARRLLDEARRPTP
jgi:heptosyltransferase II